jgi:hypothetical protein
MNKDINLKKRSFPDSELSDINPKKTKSEDEHSFYDCDHNCPFCIKSDLIVIEKQDDHEVTKKKLLNNLNFKFNQIKLIAQEPPRILYEYFSNLKDQVKKKYDFLIFFNILFKINLR